MGVEAFTPLEVPSDGDGVNNLPSTSVNASFQNPGGSPAQQPCKSCRLRWQLGEENAILRSYTSYGGRVPTARVTNG